MKACVTGATGFVGAHVARRLSDGGHDLQVAYRNPKRLKRLVDVRYRPVEADVLDLGAMRRAVRGADVVFHTAGFVASSPVAKVWEMNAKGPRVAVEAAAAEGVRRVVLTSTISAIGTAEIDPADETNEYPDGGLGLTYADAKRQGEEEALEAGAGFGVEVVIVNPAYVLGVPVDRSQPGETSTRTVGNYLRGRLPAIADAPMNFVDVEDVSAGHLLAAEHGRDGERYILGGHNLRWAELIDRLAELSGADYPLLVLPGEIARVARLRETLRLPGLIAAEGYELMAQDWRFSSDKARAELGYEPRPLDETLRATIGWYQELMASGTFENGDSSALSVAAQVVQAAGRVGLVQGLQVGGLILGRRLVAGA